MKIKLALAACLVLFTGSNVMAGAETLFTDAASGIPIAYQFSENVKGYADGTDNVGTNYEIVTFNSKGTLLYGTNASPGFFQKQKGSGDVDANNKPANPDFGTTGWAARGGANPS